MLKARSGPLVVGCIWLAATVGIAVACIGTGVSMSTMALLLAPCVGPIVIVLLMGSDLPQQHAAELVHETPAPTTRGRPTAQ
jgi:hypothetical protein